MISYESVARIGPLRRGLAGMNVALIGFRF